MFVFVPITSHPVLLFIIPEFNPQINCLHINTRLSCSPLLGASVQPCNSLVPSFSYSHTQEYATLNYKTIVFLFQDSDYFQVVPHSKLSLYAFLQFLWFVFFFQMLSEYVFLLMTQELTFSRVEQV